MFMKTFEDGISVLINKRGLNEALKPRLVELLEKIKYSDPMSNESLQTIEDEMQQQYEKLRQGIMEMDEEEAKDLIEELSEKVDERNIYCKRGKR